MTFSQPVRPWIRRSRQLVCLAALGLLAAPAFAQTFPFLIRLQQGSTLSTIPNQATITLGSAGIGKPATATVTITYQGTASATITAAPQLTQSPPDFSATLSASVPIALNPGDSFTMTLQFTPSVSTPESALINLPYSQGGASGSIQFTLLGATSTLSVTYTLPTNQNTVPLPPGGTVLFPPTLVTTSITATIAISNTGTGPGTVIAISTPDGTPFQIVGRPALPATINPGVTLIFGVKYTPTQAATDTGTLTINLDGASTNYVLSGSGITSSYSYTLNDSPITLAQPIAFPDTTLGATASFFIKVRNTGGASGVINAISATGVFAVTDGPTLFPVTLKPNDQVTFTLTFAPVLPGKVTGKLTVGNDVFDLAGTGLGPKLTFSYGPASVAVLPGGTVVFSPVQVGQSSQQSFTMVNAGTLAATIASIAVADTRGVYKLADPPPGLPVTLNPGDTLTFGLVFSPALTGFSTTALQIDAQTFTLTGSGTPPPPLPDIQFTGASGNIAALQQPAIGLTLAAPYSLPLTGVLTISVNSAVFAPDPSVLFSTGGRTVTFTIPVNATQAVFPTGGNQILLQTGTTAGTITITPTFASLAGLDLTPQTPPTLTLTVPASAPQLIKIQITNVNQAGFVIGVTGLTTTHSLSTLTYLFTPTSGKPVSYSLDVSAASGLWYTSTSSQPFGGQFSVAVPFAIPNPSTTALSTVKLKSVSVTAASAQGTSNSVSLTIQ